MKMSFKQQVVAFVLAMTGAAGAQSALAQDPFAPAAPAAAGVASDAGFYGGVVLRQGSREGTGLQVGSLTSAWGKFVPPTADESAPRTLLFGGYRWANDVAVEAAFGTVDRYTLTPGGRGGVGLALASPTESTAPRSWNADVYTSWAFRKDLALYGRLGYTQTDPQLVYTPGTFLTVDPRRTRDGMNYGVGLRYDVTRALGLRVEYARFGRFVGETPNGLLPESDQVQFGMQLRF